MLSQGRKATSGSHPQGIFLPEASPRSVSRPAETNCTRPPAQFLLDLLFDSRIASKSKKIKELTQYRLKVAPLTSSHRGRFSMRTGERGQPRPAPCPLVWCWPIPSSTPKRITAF